MVHIGATSRGDSFPLSSTAPRSHFIHSPRPCNPEIHVIMCPKPVWEKKCHIDGADQTVTLIAVKSSTNALNHSPVRLPAGLTPPNRTISLLETKRVDQVVNLKYLCLLPKLQPDISKRRNIRYHQIRDTGGRNQLSNKLGTTLSVGLNPAVTSVTRNRLYPTSHLLHLQLFSHRLSPRHAVASLCMCLVTFTEHLGLFWGFFRFFYICKHAHGFPSKLSQHIPQLLRSVIASPGSPGAYYTSSSIITSLILCLFIVLYCTYH